MTQIDSSAVYLYDVLSWMLCCNQTLSVIIQLGDGSLLALQTFTDEVLLGWDYLASCTTLWPIIIVIINISSTVWLCSPSYLVLPLSCRVVQVGVTPVIVKPLVCLLVHPEQLIGAALHAVPQAEQMLLTSTRAGLVERKTNLKSQRLCIWWWSECSVTQGCVAVDLLPAVCCTWTGGCWHIPADRRVHSLTDY